MQGKPTRPGAFHFQTVAATVAAGVGTDIATFDVSALDQVYINITVAVDDLTEFNVLARALDGGVFGTLAVDAADYTTPTPPVIRASGALTTAAVGEHNLLFDVRGMESIKINAKSAGTGTVALEVGGN